jgi:hypothetical protein
MLQQGPCFFPCAGFGGRGWLRGASLCHIASPGHRTRLTAFRAVFMLPQKTSQVVLGFAVVHESQNRPSQPQCSRSCRGLRRGDVAKRSASEPRRRPLHEWRIEPRTRPFPMGRTNTRRQIGGFNLF